jgi:4'-phosphopantetheinyl transferase EntD
MHYWKLTQTLSNPKDNDWECLSKLALGEKVHPDRKHGFLLARQALLDALHEAGENFPISKLQIENHNKIKESDSFTLSLSHTAEWGAAILATRDEYKSVGIDIEHEKRAVKDLIISRIAHPEDERLRNIELWCLKEAAFKALMNSGYFDKPLEFSSIKIGDKKWFHSPSNLSGEWELEVINSIIVARAYLKI